MELTLFFEESSNIPDQRQSCEYAYSRTHIDQQIFVLANLHVNFCEMCQSQ